MSYVNQGGDRAAGIPILSSKEQVTSVALSGVTTLHWSSVSSPRGSCVILATERGICWLGTPGTTLDLGLSWVQRKMSFVSVVEDVSSEPLRQAVDQLER